MGCNRHRAAEIAPPPRTGSALPRREFLKLLASAVGGAAVLSAIPGRRALAGGAAVAFPDGIKSGDPLPTGGTIWTRIPPPASGGSASVLWSVAEDAAMGQVVLGGMAETDADAGYSLTVPP